MYVCIAQVGTEAKSVESLREKPQLTLDPSSMYGNVLPDAQYDDDAPAGMDWVLRDDEQEKDTSDDEPPSTIASLANCLPRPSPNPGVCILQHSCHVLCV
jgi:hypothetical protein